MKKPLLVAVLVMVLIVPFGCEATRVECDYYPTDAGHYVTYSMSDTDESHPLQDCRVELMFQYSREGEFFTTLTQIGSSGGRFRDSAIFGKVRDGKLIYYGGAPVGNQAHFWYELFALPTAIEDGDTWQKDSISYHTSFVGERRVGSRTYLDCIKIEIDNTESVEPFFRGEGEIYLSKGVGIIQYVFTRSDGSVFTAEVLESGELLSTTISGRLTLDGDKPAEGYRVGLANFCHEGIDASTVDSQGGFSLRVFGHSLILRYGPLQAETADLLDIRKSKEEKIENVTGDISDLELSVGLSELPPEGEEPVVETPSEIHQTAWEQAAANCSDNDYYKYSIYSARSLAVSNPEVYLQADMLWMDMISTYGGWECNYLARDRELAGTDWWEEVGEEINDGFRHDKHSGAFRWESFNWEEHRENAVDLFDFYGDAPKLNSVDNRLVFLWNAMKGLNWKMPYTSLAEAEYLKLVSEGKKVYLILTEDRSGYVAELTGDNVVLHDPLTGELIDDVGKGAVLVMNNEHVWYPLMERDDRGTDTGLGRVVERYCEEDRRPELTEFEQSIVADLKEGTKLRSETEFSWAKLLAIRGVNQNTWRSEPLRELSAKLLPQRYKEDSNYSDSPNEQGCLGMVITEMGNRLSPTSATWAEIVQENASDPREAFQELGEQYWERFHRVDAQSEWVYGDYYRCWFPNLDDKLISGIGDCIVEATNVMAALSLADLEEWEIYETNWWSLETRGGHVICGAYTPYGDYSLSNGLFQTGGKSVLHGPLWDQDGRVAYNIIYDPSQGFLTFVQTKNFAKFSHFWTPFTNLSFERTIEFLQHMKALEETALIAVEYGSTKAETIDEYIDYVAPKADRWETNMASWPWDAEGE